MSARRKDTESNPLLKFCVSQKRGVSILATSATADAADRFDQFITRILEKRDHFLESPELLIVALSTAFEALTNETDLRAFLNQLSEASHWGGGEYVTWTRERSIARRCISPLLRIAKQNIPVQTTDWNAAVDRFAEVVSNLYPRKKKMRSASRLSSVFMDAQCWLYANLPMPHVAHVTGAVPLTHLPDSAWYRRFQMPVPELKDDSQDKVVEETEERTVEALFSNELQLSGFWYIEQLEKVAQGLTSTGSNVSDAKAWQIVSQRLSDLSLELQDCGPVEALIFGWALDIATFGTSRKVNPRVATLSRYMYSAAGRLHKKLREKQSHPLSLTHDGWKMFFEELINESPTDQSLRAALSSFHRYLCRMLGADFIPWLYDDRNHSKQPPRANIIWQHEFDRVHSILRHLSEDQRLVSQLDVWCALTRDSTLRFGELVGLQLRSIHIDEDCIELEVAPHRGRHPLKTHAARRSLRITNPASVDCIRSWLRRREVEAAAPDDFLFGDPHRPERIYHLGKCYRLFNKALKQATGDVTVSMHITRHAYISVALDKALTEIGVKFSEVNPIHRIKIAAGHSAEWTTIESYGHLSEDSLRIQIDRQIESRFRSCAAAARWTGLTEENLRQKKHRHSPKGWKPWHAVQSEAHAQPPKTKASAADLPIQQTTAPPAITCQTVCHVLADLEYGYDYPSVVSRCGVPDHLVSRIQTITKSLKLLDGNKTLDEPIVCRFDRLCSQVWNRFISHVSQLDTEQICAVIESWRRCTRGLMLSLDQPSKARPLLRALRDSGIPLTRLVVRVSRKPSSAPTPTPTTENNRTLDKALALLAQVYNGSPQVEQMSPRRGRPLVYLQLFTTTLTGSACAAPAACDMSSLNGAMVVSSTLLQLKNSLNA